MTIDFTMSAAQKAVQVKARKFAESVLAPLLADAEQELDLIVALAKRKPAYIEAYRLGIATAMLPAAYGGGGLSCLDFTIATEEISAVDPGFACTVLCNGLGLMPVIWYGTETQKRRFVGAATSDPNKQYLAAWTAAEPPGATKAGAHFDNPLSAAGIGLSATLRGDHYILKGRKKWSSAAGWDGMGADSQTVIVRTGSESGATRGLSAIVVERGTPGVKCSFADHEARRTTSNAIIEFDNAVVPVENLLPGTESNGDRVVNRNFACFGPVAAIAAAGVARAAYEVALRFAKRHTGHSLPLISRFDNVGYVLGEVATKIESARYFAWRAADYLDKHDHHGEIFGAMCKINVTETMFDCVFKCMQIVGVHSSDSEFSFNRHLHDAALLPIYDGGNMALQRRRVKGVLAHERFNPRAAMDDEPIYFQKHAEAAGLTAEMNMSGTQATS
ncbi:acyl-CoA dehydrogenase family protein [Caballeronia insecticola]|uniref:Acyl-CoA dehydrogenase domain protein n=1 Tax=Caballeronia insecticola TaxID=758793 RepID=R4WP56_9BURK|nr:acyl-CoA dehydrogenase family protein [Caballeronia insecticola]BAN26344.1 acyl-CoA dehydrogenase domain protein [Caballeronia insecticola]